MKPTDIEKSVSAKTIHLVLLQKKYSQIPNTPMRKKPIAELRSPEMQSVVKINTHVWWKFKVEATPSCATHTLKKQSEHSERHNGNVIF